jgi:hypothetical protein
MNNCQDCDNFTICSKCAKNYVLSSDSTKCVSKCSDICYTCIDNQPNKCLSCLGGYSYDIAKQTCTVDISCNSTATCIACPLNNVLVNGNCLTCNVADTNCDNCLASSPTTCSSCASGYYLSSNLNCTVCP